MFDALKDENKVHDNFSNILETSYTSIGDFEKNYKEAEYKVEHRYETQRIEHGFLEVEAAIALPQDDGTLEILSESQGVYEDRRQISEILGLDEEKVRVRLIPNGGGFGGKEDLSIQGQTALFAWLIQKPVKLVLTRQESIRLHPKRHPIVMDYKVGVTKDGKISAVKLEAYGDTGAYMSVGTKVLERVAGHATAGYFVPNVEITAKTLYTNNIPCGAMRGFGANQATFAFEVALDEICEIAGFDRWQFSDTIIEIVNENKVILKHGWTEMGQGVNTVARLIQKQELKPE